MAQYTELSSTGSESFELENGSDKFRLQVRSNVLYYDQEITSLGFDGDIDVDWGTIESVALPDDPGPTFRVGVRDTYWVIDQTYEPEVFGFDGEIGFDWENLEQHQLP